LAGHARQDVNGSLERVRLALERLRVSSTTGSGASGVQATLAHCSDLLAALETVMPAIEERIRAGEWHPADALSARAALDIYDRAVADLRQVAAAARREVDAADELFEAVHQFARDSRHQAERIERRMSDPPSEPTE
jgi:hypothetical protein